MLISNHQTWKMFLQILIFYQKGKGNFTNWGSSDCCGLCNQAECSIQTMHNTISFQMAPKGLPLVGQCSGKKLLFNLRNDQQFINKHKSENISGHFKNVYSNDTLKEYFADTINIYNLFHSWEFGIQISKTEFKSLYICFPGDESYFTKVNPTQNIYNVWLNLCDM